MITLATLKIVLIIVGIVGVTSGVIGVAVESAKDEQEREEAAECYEEAREEGVSRRLAKRICRVKKKKIKYKKPVSGHREY